MQKLAKPEKLKVIRALLNGSMNLSALRPPQTYVIYHQENEDTYHVEGTTMNRVEYEAWCLTVREIDNVILFSERKSYADGNAPMMTDEEVEALNNTFASPKKEGLESPLMTPQENAYDMAQPKEEKQAPVIELPAIKTRGLLSTYGEDWTITDEFKYTDNGF